jgi:release factor glutamine methyltransferase
MQIKDAVKAAAKRLEQVSPTPVLEANVILSHILGVNNSYLLTWPDRYLSSDQVAELDDMVTRREAKEPLAYIFEEKEFWSLLLTVNEDTLIPRPETELLVETCLAVCAGQSAAQVLDLGTGSGAIAVALAHEQPRWHLTAVDASTKALAVAQLNADKFNCRNCHFLQSNWFAELQGRRFHAIISNPPYIDRRDPEVAFSVLRYEPEEALFADDDGLADLAAIIKQAPDHLELGGYLLLEHGYRQGKAVRKLFQERGFTGVDTLLDIAHRERVTLGQFTQNPE